MRRTVLVAGAAIGAVLLIVALGVSILASRETQPAPDAEEAHRALEIAADLARTGDMDRLCAEVSASRGTCRFILDGAAPPAGDRPEIVCEGQFSGTGDGLDGWAMRVTGVDALRADYSSDILAISTTAGTRLQMAVYWTGIRIAVGSESGMDFDPCTGGTVVTQL